MYAEVHTQFSKDSKVKGSNVAVKHNTISSVAAEQSISIRLGEPHMHLDPDDCVGQNKNNTMLPLSHMAGDGWAAPEDFSLLPHCQVFSGLVV